MLPTGTPWARTRAVADAPDGAGAGAPYGVVVQHPAPAEAALAGQPVGHDLDVPELPRHPVGPTDHPSLEQDGTSDAGAHRHHQGRHSTSSCAVAAAAQATPRGRNCTLTRGPTGFVVLGTACSQVRWHEPPMTSRSPEWSSNARDAPPPTGRSRPRGGGRRRPARSSGGCAPAGRRAARPPTGTSRPRSTACPASASPHAGSWTPPFASEQLRQQLWRGTRQVRAVPAPGSARRPVSLTGAGRAEPPDRREPAALNG